MSEERGRGPGVGQPGLTAKDAMETIEDLVGTVISTMRTNTDNWLNSGWSVKKRAGQWLPEVRPNTEDIALRLAPSGDVPAVGHREANGSGDAGETIDVQIAAPLPAPVDMEAARRSGLGEVSSANLQSDFLAFLAERESADANDGAVSVSSDGAITFKSRTDLARMVAEFSFGKLRQVSAAARALARYVDDLESELETADVQVVQLRAQMREAAAKAAERDADLADVQQRASAVESRLGATIAELEAGEQALLEAERRAEDAATQLLDLQRSLREAEARGESIAEQRREAEKLGVKFETQLLDAERRALAGERTKRKLAAELDQLARARADADMRAQSAKELALAMEERSLAAEALAERKAEELDKMLSQRERTSEQLQAVVDSVESRLSELAKAAAMAGEGAPAAQAGGGAAQGLGALDLQAETERLRAELRDILDTDHADLRASSPPSYSSAGRPSSAPGSGAGLGEGSASGLGRPLGPPPLSRMRKADLVAECEVYGINSAGTVAELRARLRAERKQRRSDEEAAQAPGAEGAVTVTEAALPSVGVATPVVTVSTGTQAEAGEGQSRRVEEQLAEPGGR